MRSKWFYKIKWVFIALALGSGFCCIFANEEMWTRTELFLAFLIYAIGALFAFVIDQAEKENAKLHKDACRFKVERGMLIAILEHIDEQQKEEQRKNANA